MPAVAARSASIELSVWLAVFSIVIALQTGGSGVAARAAQEMEKVRVLVEQGSLPPARLKKAEEDLADAQDQETLGKTLYGQIHLENMTPEEGTAMLEAAERRESRSRAVVEQQRLLLAQGMVARADFAACEEELRSRQHVVELAQNRVRLLADLKQMAETEKRMEQAAASGSLKEALIRFDGSGVFELSELAGIARRFEEKFHQALPVSALGETALHRSMGLDHRNRVDVALNPESTEGLWLRRLLEQLRIPYLAFRTAVAGAATAPHIHIGTGSPRIVNRPAS